MMPDDKKLGRLTMPHAIAAPVGAMVRLTAVLLVLLVSLPSSTEGLSQTALMYISNSLALNRSAVSCESIANATVCALTSGCIWAVNTSASPTSNTSTNATTGNYSCVSQAVIPTINGTAPAGIASSWCFNYFPIWFISCVYFLASLTLGFCIAGLWYHYKYYDVYVTVLDGERLYNKYYYKTSPMNVFMGILVAASLMLLVSALVYLEDEFNCVYVPMTILYLIVTLGMPLISGILYAGWLWLEWYNKRILDVDLELFITPKTVEALPSLNNHVRCF